MPDRTRKRKRPNNANALARWDNEGGAAKGAPQKARDDMTFAVSGRRSHHAMGRSAYGYPA